MKVLFIGNSHTYFNDMPKIVEAIAKRCGVNDLETTMFTAGGMSLIWHSEQKNEMDAILNGDFDKAVLQDNAHPFFGTQHLRDGVVAINEYLKKKNVKPHLYMTWASKAQPEVQSEMIDSYNTVATEISATVDPVGIVWQKVRENTDIDLFYTDGEHASKYGSYLSACVHFCILMGYNKLIPDAEGDFYKEYGVDLEPCNIIHKYVYETLK